MSTKIILVVDDDETFLGILANTLVRDGYEVVQAMHGKSAKEIISLQELHAVISDVNMPGVSGLELLKFTKEFNPNLPFVLMTGFSELKETKEAYDLGVSGFLPKPFKKNDLTVLLQQLLHAGESSERSPVGTPGEVVDLDYCKLSIEDFVSGKEIKYDIYIRLSDEKFVKIANQGENIPVERVTAYKAKNINFLYLRKDDFRKYMGLNLTLLPAVTAHSKFSADKKRAFLKHTSEVVMENIYVNGVDDQAFCSAKAVVESSISLLTEPDDMMNLLMLLNSHADHLYAHCLGVSTYSVMIAREVQWHSPANIFKVAMGGFLHDVGKKEIPRSILDKPRQDLSAEEVLLYESHPQRGVEVLSGISTIPSDVMQIVMQHHENCLGLGFPLRLTKQHIHPMARLVTVANDFCTAVLRGPRSLGLTPIEALQRMHTMQQGKYDLQFLTALMKVFKVDIVDL